MAEKKFEDYKAKTIPIYKDSRGSIQRLIPINRISRDGIFEIEDRPKDEEKTYDKCYLMVDTNYVINDEDEKDLFLRQWCKILNALNVSFKIIVMNNNRDMKTYKRDSFFDLENEKDGDIVRSLKETFNEIIRSRAEDGAAGIEQVTTAVNNLDMILSIGYRVNSRSAIAFRQWANKVLKEYLVKGYALRTNMQLKQYEELKQLVGVLQHTMQTEALTTNEARDLVNVVTDYTYALDTLDNYDYQRLAISDTVATERFHATYENAMEAIHSLKEKFGESWLFGNEKDDSFKSSMGQIYQTFGGQELYPSVEEKAAMLLYLVTKNHSFSDGNKRIAATLFLWFLNNNGILYREDGTKRLADNTLVALTLMIAESRTEEKDTMVKVVVNLINQKN